MADEHDLKELIGKTLFRDRLQDGPGKGYFYQPTELEPTPTRGGIESLRLESDGSLKMIGPGASDRRQSRHGTWERDASGSGDLLLRLEGYLARARIHNDDGQNSSLEIVAEPTPER